MAKVKVQITERLVRTVEVDASTETEAVEKAKQLYSNQDVVLEYDDFDGFAEFKSEAVPDEKTTFYLSRDTKTTVWERQNFSIRSANKQEALQSLIDDPGMEPDSYETLWDTQVDVQLEENKGFSTIEIIDSDSVVLYKNGVDVCQAN